MYKIKDGFIIRKIGGRIMAVPIGSRTGSIHGMIALTESGELLWNVLEKGADTEKLVTVLTDNYEVEKTVAIADVEKFIANLAQQGVLE